MNILDLLRARYHIDEGWLTFTEIAPDARLERRADLVAVNVWASKRHVAVFEIKQSRADFRRELDDPSKRAAFDFANEFSFVAPKGVIPTAEVPEGCGLLEVVGDPPKLRAAVRAKQRARVDTEAFLWRVLGKVHKDRVAEKIRTDQDPWAKLAGKDVSIDDLKRLGLALWNARHQRYFDHEVNRRVDIEVAKRLPKDKWGVVIRELIAQRSVDTGDRWRRESPGDLLKWLQGTALRRMTRQQLDHVAATARKVLAAVEATGA